MAGSQRDDMVGEKGAGLGGEKGAGHRVAQCRARVKDRPSPLAAQPFVHPMSKGDYEAFRSWSGKPRSWGPEQAGWRAWFGGKVVDGLCEVLDEHLAAKRRGVPAAIGCVPWLTSEAVTDRRRPPGRSRRARQGTSVPARLLNPDKASPTLLSRACTTWLPPRMGQRRSSGRGRRCPSMILARCGFSVSSEMGASPSCTPSCSCSASWPTTSTVPTTA